MFCGSWIGAIPTSDTQQTPGTTAAHRRMRPSANRYGIVRNVDIQHGSRGKTFWVRNPMFEFQCKSICVRRYTRQQALLPAALKNAQRECGNDKSWPLVNQKRENHTNDSIRNASYPATKVMRDNEVTRSPQQHSFFVSCCQTENAPRASG